MAKKYAVRIEGRGCRARVTNAAGSEEVTSGFFATRFVEALNEADAMKMVLSLVRGELSEYGLESPDKCELEVEEIREDPSAFDCFAPGKGFTWF